jgi:hypothetical protein
MGRISGLRTLQTDSVKQRLLTEVVDTVRTSVYTDKIIGLLESYAAVETDPIKKSMAESIIEDLIDQGGEWCQE